VLLADDPAVGHGHNAIGVALGKRAFVGDHYYCGGFSAVC